MQKFFFHHLDLQCCSSIKTLCKVVSHCNEYFYYACTFNSLCMCVCTKSQEAHQVNPMHPVTQLQNTPALTSGIWGTSTTWRPCCCFGTCGEMDTFWKHNGELAQRWTVCTLGKQSSWTSCITLLLYHWRGPPVIQEECDMCVHPVHLFIETGIAGFVDLHFWCYFVFNYYCA